MMAELFEELALLDKLIHEPARLAIMTALSACESADFLFLQRLTGLSKGNLSSHLSKLETADLVHIHKQFVGKKPHTGVALSDKGRLAIEHHWQQLEELRQNALKWKPME
jgi:DNA-binding transcriptional ArsR family regulator